MFQSPPFTVATSALGLWAERKGAFQTFFQMKNVNKLDFYSFFKIKYVQKLVRFSSC